MQLGASFLRRFSRDGAMPGRATLARFVVLGALLLGAASVAGACGGDRSCYDADDCDCFGRRECILGCYHDGCDLACSHTASACGAICEDDCRFLCHDTNHCSALCGNDCAYRCHQTPSCAAECGARCAYECHDVSECAVRVGPGSTVACTAAALCDVTCDGPCEVSCNDVSRCNVSCAPGLVRSNRGGGRWSCE